MKVNESLAGGVSVGNYQSLMQRSMSEQPCTFPGLVISVFIATLPLSMFQVGGFASVQRPINLILLVVVLVVLLKRRVLIRWDKGSLFWLLYVMWLLITVLWSSKPGTSLITALGMVSLFALLLMLAMLPLTDRDLGLIRIAWVFVAYFAGALFLAFGEQATVGGRTHLILPTGGSDPNEFSAYFILPLAYFADALFKESGFARVFGLFSLIGSLYIVLMTGSRAGALASLLVLILVGVRHGLRGFGRLVQLVSAVAVISLISVLYILPALPDAVRSRLSFEALQEDRGSNREDIWKTGLELMKASDWQLIFGYGPHGAVVERTTMHNHFLQAFVDGGLVGALLLLLILAFALRYSIQDPPVFAATLGMVVMMSTLTVYSNFRPAWAVIFMAMLVAKQATNSCFVSKGGAGRNEQSCEDSRC